jgi:hypothetical protein
MVVVQRDDERRRAYVVTHIRGDRWLIATGRPFPGGHRVARGEHRTIVSESEIVAMDLEQQ